MNQRLSGSDISLNTPIDQNDGNSSEMVDLIADSKSSQEIILASSQSLNNQKKILSEAMQVLNEREAKILTARKLHHSPSTLDVLSNEYNISKERVRQIETAALKKMRSLLQTEAA